MIVAILTTALAGTAWAQTTIYSETFGDNGSNNTVYSSYSNYSATSSMFVGEETVASHYTGSGKVGKNSVSPSDYTGASGLSAAWYTGAKNSSADALIISGININGYEDLSLSFGINMTNGASNTNTTTVSYKIDDGAYQTLSFTHPTSSGWSVKSGSITGTGSSLTIKFTMATTGGFTTRYDDIKVTGTSTGGGSTAVTTTTTIDATGITNTDVHTSTAAGSLSATVTANGSAVQGATVTWSSSNESVATVAADGTVTLVAAGTTNITASYAGVENQYQASTSTPYVLTVTDSTPDPYIWIAAPITELTASDVFVIVCEKGGTSHQAMKNNNGASTHPTTVTVTVENGKITSQIYEYIKWNISIGDDGYTFYPNGDTENWLYCTNTNDGVRVGTNTNNVFTIRDGYLFNTATSRYVGTYNSVDWRCYTSSGGNIANQTITFYKRVEKSPLSSIALSGDYPTTFHVGDTFSPDGIIVTATYENGRTADVTDSANFTGYDMSTAGTQTVTVSYTEEEVTKTATYSINVNAPATLTSITLSGTYPTTFYEGDTFSHEGIVVTANYDDSTTADVTSEATFSEPDMTTVGSKTITVSYGGQTATYTITVEEKKGTATNPYTVAQAIAFINTLGTATSAEEVYVSGIISRVDSYNSNYSSITYWISDDGTTASQMEVYSGLGLNGADFSSKDDLQVGDIVTVKGYVKKYNNTPEFDYNSVLVSFNRTEPSVTVTPNTINAPFAGADGNLTLTYENIADFTSFDFKFCNAQGGDLEEDPDWIDAEIQVENDIYSLYYVIVANNGDARTAYIKVYTFDDNLEEVYAIVTVNQAAADYATLPFAYDGNGTGTLPAGFTVSGLGTYDSSPKMKFDGTGDYAILKINDRPGVLTFDILGNGFSGGTFKVQTSEDGTTYTDLKTYGEISGSKQSEEFGDLGENVRFIKWVYIEKVSGNVALGNINLAEYNDTPSIAVDPATVEVVATPEDVLGEGTLPLTYANLSISDITDFGVQYCDAEGEEITQPDWFEALVAEENGSYMVSYTYLANEDDAPRTAYFKVFAIAGNDFVYSNLVTVTQKANVVVEYKVLAMKDMSGNYQAISSDAGEKSGALAAVAVDIVNNKAITSNEKLMWFVEEPTSGSYTIKNKETDQYLNYNGANLSTGDDASVWSFGTTKDGYADSWYIMDNTTRRTIMYRDGYEFKNYSVNYLGNSGYSSSSLAAYDYSDGYTRTVAGGNYGTICLPYDVAADDFSGVTFYKIAGKKMDGTALVSVSLEEVTSLNAGCAYIFKANDDRLVAAYSGTKETEPWSADISETGLTGTYVRTAIPQGCYVLKDGKIWYVDKANYMYSGANKAYIDLTNVPEAGAGVKQHVLFSGDIDDPTAITEFSENAESTEAIYNVAGQRVGKMQKGIYIVNGKKILK